MADGITLVTGASGTVGAAVVRLLRAAAAPARAAVPRPQPDGGDTVPFDFGTPDTWPAAFAGVDRLFLMRPPMITDVKAYIRPVVRFAADHGVRHVVFLSVMGVNRLFPHWRVERDIEETGLPYTFLRPAFFAQNLVTAYRHDISHHDRIRLSSGRGKTSFVDSRDVAAVAVAALQDPRAHVGAKHVLTGPHALSYDEVASMLSAALGRPVHYEPISALRYRKELLAQGQESSFVNVQLVINAVAALGLASTVTDTIPEVLGRAATPMRTFIADHVEMWSRAAADDSSG